MYRQQDVSAGAAPQHGFLSASTPSSSFSQTQFPSPLFAPDPSLHGSPRLLHPAIHRDMARPLSPNRRASNELQGLMMQPPRSVSPRTSKDMPERRLSAPGKPVDRYLPEVGVTETTIADAYVAFILYCNPHFALDTDTTSLRANFHSPPKSDGKDFSTYRLFVLIQMLDAKEIKTWGQLALDLGVEAPDVSKGQSVQKVQQYSVRLKRWMHAMHIDAFFEYLLAKPHPYFTNIPHATDPYPAGGRDGVLAEEDLAIGALDPSFKRKRGRRRNIDTEQYDELAAGLERNQSGLASERPDGSWSAYPASGHPDSYRDPWAMVSAITPQSVAPWKSGPAASQSATTPHAPSYLREQLQKGSGTVATPNPMTAQPTSMASRIEAAFTKEPQSAVLPSARKKRKHGPAVSSAWPSAKVPGAKPRGRPPASRNLQNGPYGTFPADPANERLNAGPRSSAPDLTPISRVIPPFRPPLAVGRQSESLGRPGRLSLQVPQHTGGPVRLATPPPKLLVNGETDDSDSVSMAVTPTVESAPTLLQPQLARHRVVHTMQQQDRVIPGFAFEVLKRVLTSDLLRAELVGRNQRLNGDEAKSLADAVLSQLGIPREDTDVSRDDIARLTAASWLGLGEQLNVPLGPATGQGKRVNVTRFRVDAEGYEEIVSAHEKVSGGVREVFDLSWTVSMAGCNGAFEMKGLALGDLVPVVEDSHDIVLKNCLAAARQVGNEGVAVVRQAMQDAGQQPGGAEGASGAEDGVDWRAKYMAMEFGCRMAMGEMRRIKGRLVEQLLDPLL